jgi:hypothetical protein
VRVTDPAAPDGCRWCGIEARGHGLQFTPEADWHSWEPPTDAQRLARMRARRAAAQARRPRQPRLASSPDPSPRRTQ